MKIIIRYLILLTVLIGAVTNIQAEPFEKIKADLADAKGLSIHFISLVESSIFETVDSFPGYAMICADGRYFMEVGADQFLFDGSYLYSYSPGNNQVIVENMATGEQTGEQITFIAKLDNYFDTKIITETGEYKLNRKENASGALPELMTITLDSTKKQMTSITYTDINDDLNWILLDSINYMTSCDSTRLIPDFPDSAETVRMF